MSSSKLKLINQIQKVRSKNNKYWMDVLKLAFKSAPDSASKIMKKINTNDQKISKLVEELSKKNN